MCHSVVVPQELAGLHRSPSAGAHGPWARTPYLWPGPMPGIKPCQDVDGVLGKFNAYLGAVLGEQANFDGVGHLGRSSKIRAIGAKVRTQGWGIPEEMSTRASYPCEAPGTRKRGADRVTKAGGWLPRSLAGCSPEEVGTVAGMSTVPAAPVCNARPPQ